MALSTRRHRHERSWLRSTVLAASVLVVLWAGMPGAAASGTAALAPSAPSAPLLSADSDKPTLAHARLNGSGELVAYDVIDGMAVIDQDILLGTHAEVQANGIDMPEVGPPASCPEGMECGVIDTSERRRWPNGVVPYTLAPGTPSDAAANVAAALAEWEAKTSIDFVARTTQSDYVQFTGTGAGNTCSSYLGRVGGMQEILYAGNGRGCLVHEIGHAVGLSHEHNRNDRDEYITIDFTNVSGNAASQFRKATGSTDVGQYDFSSVMHYSAYSFALDRSRPVIVPRDPNVPLSAVGGRGVLTPSDVQAVELVYGSGNPPPPPTTTTTTRPTTTTTTRPTTTSTIRPSTTQPSTTRPSTTVPSSVPSSPPSTAPTTATSVVAPSSTFPTTIPTTSSTVVLPPTIGPPTTVPTAPSTVEPPTTYEPSPTVGPPTTVPSSTTTITRPLPTGDRRPVVQFLTLTDGGTIPTRLPYGGIRIGANDPDAGAADGSGIRSVTLVLTDTETGRFLGSRREYRSTYDWGIRLTSGRSYTLTAYALSTRAAGGGWSQASVTVTAG